MTQTSSQDPSRLGQPAPTEATTERSEQEILAQRAETPEEQAELSALLREMHHTESSLPPRMRKIGWATALLAFVTLGVLTGVLVRDVRLATRMYGPRVLLSGGYSSYRISVFDPEKTQFFKNLHAQLWLLGPQQQKKLLFRGDTEQDVLLANVKIPAWPPGEQYQLKLSVVCPAGKEEFIRPVTLRSASQHQPRFAAESSRRLWEFAPVAPNSPYRVQLFADNRAPIADLSSVFWLRIQERPMPRPPAPRRPTSRPAPQATSHQPTSRPVPQATSQPGPQPGKATTRPAPASQPTSDFPVLPEPAMPRHRSQQPLNPFAPKATQTAKPPAARNTSTSWTIPSSRLQVQVRHGRSLHDELQTDAFGFVHFSYVAQMFDARWVITVRGPAGTYEFQRTLKPEGYQLVLDVPKVIVAPKEKLFLRVDGLHSKSDLHVDLTQHGHRIWSYKGQIDGGRAALSIPLPAHIRGLISVQVYTEFYFPGEIHDEHLVYVGQPSRKELFAALQQHLTQRGDGVLVYDLQDLQRQLPPTAPPSHWVKPVFSLFKARFVPPTMYYNSANDRLRRLRGYQHRFRKGTILFLVGLSGCVVAGIFLWLFVGYQRNQQRMRDAAEENDVEVVKTRGLSLLFLFITLLSAIFAAIILLFWAMQWTYDKI